MEQLDDRMRFTVFDTECQCEIEVDQSDGFLLPEEQQWLDEFVDMLGGGSYFVFPRPAHLRISKLTPNPNWSMTLVNKEDN